ncbi:hypothetical protein Tco_0934847 [Tanacetum coccineum]
MAETMEQYMSKTRTNYGSGVARPKIEEKVSFELKGKFLKELRENTLAARIMRMAKNTIEKSEAERYVMPLLTTTLIRISELAHTKQQWN